METKRVMTRLFPIRGFFALLILSLLPLLFPEPVQAYIVPPPTHDNLASDPPYCCECVNRGPCIEVRGGSSAISLTEGNLRETYYVTRLKSANGPTIDFSLTYNGYNADESRERVDTGLGDGWTHSYNIFLFQEKGHLFRMDRDGRIIKYEQGPDGIFRPTPGYFEALAQNPDGTFTLAQKDGTVFTFAQIPGTLFPFTGPVFRLISIVDSNGNVTALSYSNGNLTAITDTYGRRLTLEYNQSKLIAIIDPLGRTTRLEYDFVARRLTEITDPDGKRVQYTYNPLNQIIGKADKDGRTFIHVYDGRDKPVEIYDGVGRVFSLTNTRNWATDPDAVVHDRVREYLPATTTRTDGRSNVWKYDYDKNGYITRVVAPDGATTTYTYDPATLMIPSVTDANGQTTRYEYDGLGNNTKMTNALGHVWIYTYEPVFNKMTRMTDPNGRVTTYEYDARGNRIKETDPLGNTRQWTYDANGNILTEKDKNGNLTRHEYNAFGNRIKTTDAVGNLKTRTDDNNHTTIFVYDGLDRLVLESDPLGATTQTFYDGSGNRIRVIDRNANSTVFNYDLRQRLIETTDALRRMTTQAYDGSDNRTTISDKNGRVSRFQYDVQNRLIGITDARGNVTRRAYDAVGNILTETDANNHTTRYAYDELNRRTTQTDAVGCVTRFEYDLVGLPGCPDCTGPARGSSLVTKQTDGNGKATYLKYDGLDRLIIQIRKEGDTADHIDSSDAETDYTYDPNGNLRFVTEPNDNTTGYRYDALNRRTKETNGAGDVTRFEYDGVGNVIKMFAPNGNVTTNTYDDRDRLSQVEDLVGSVAIYTYDNVGNRLTEADGNGNTTIFDYDLIYRLTTVTDPLLRTTRYEYDPVGNLIKITDREGNTTKHIYDAINRRTSTTNALGHFTRFVYDRVGNLVRIVDAKGNATQYNYDSVNRRVREVYADGGIRTFTYDCVGKLLTRKDQRGQLTRYTYNDLYFLIRRDYPVNPDDNFTYDLSGRMLTAERGGWLVNFEYDGANRIRQTTQNRQTIDYVYDVPGRTRTITYPGGRVITEQMDFRNRLDVIDELGIPTPIVQYTYDSGNRVGNRTYRNSTGANFAYNDNNWVLELEHSFGGPRIAGFRYDYDKEGNKRFDEKRDDLTHSEAYRYDNIYRLIDFKAGQLVGSTVRVPLTQTQYNLDKLGNWDNKTTDGKTEIRTHNVVNEITKIGAVPITHDDNGNLQEDERFTYAYDEENRLIRVTRKSDNRVVGQYQYDALSRRVVKIAKTTGTPIETRYFYDEARIIEEQSSTNATQAAYVYGNYIDEVLTMDRGGETFFYHQNALSSVAALTDNSANVVERSAYDAYGCVTITDGAGNPVSPNPWGMPHSAIGNPHFFTGRQLDEETGLYFYRARYYDCVKGRFLQRDPLWYVNPYEYGSSNPVNRYDPSGLWDVQRIGGRRANAILQRGDTINTLADKIGLNPSEWQKWLQVDGPPDFWNAFYQNVKPDTPIRVPRGDVTFTVPNTAYIDMFLTDWDYLIPGPNLFYRWMRLRSNRIEARWKGEGLKVVYSGGENRFWVIVSHMEDDSLYKYMFVGHGDQGNLSGLRDPDRLGAAKIAMEAGTVTFFGINEMRLIGCETNWNVATWRTNVSAQGSLETVAGCLGLIQGTIVTVSGSAK